MDWDDICWNPHEASFQQGEINGSNAGRLAGFNDGKASGRVKGFELGMEIGFIHGFLRALEEEMDSGIVEKNERIQRSIDHLRKVLQEEPLEPDAVFVQTQSLKTDAKSSPSTISATDLKKKNENGSNSPSDVSKVDVQSKLQRIRARFKVLIVQLKMTKSSLKDVMDEAATSSSVLMMTKEEEEEELPWGGEW